MPVRVEREPVRWATEVTSQGEVTRPVTASKNTACPLDLACPGLMQRPKGIKESSPTKPRLAEVAETALRQIRSRNSLRVPLPRFGCDAALSRRCHGLAKRAKRRLVVLAFLTIRYPVRESQPNRSARLCPRRLRPHRRNETSGFRGRSGRSLVAAEVAPSRGFRSAWSDW